MTSINFVIGDATRPQGEGPRIIAHCCNDVGAWGAGFVLAISRRWKSPEARYLSWAERTRPDALPLGEVQFVDVLDQIVIANIIGQRGCGYTDGVPPVRYDAIMRGFVRVAAEALRRRASVHMPRLGCGLAGGDWQTVEKIISDTLCAHDLQVTVYDLEVSA